MQVSVLSYTCSVRKTVASSHLLAPRMNSAQIFAVESTNETGADLGLNVDQLRGEHFGRLFRELLTRDDAIVDRSEEHTSELQSLMRISSAVLCWKQKITLDPLTLYTKQLTHQYPTIH